MTFSSKKDFLIGLLIWTSTLLGLVISFIGENFLIKIIMLFTSAMLMWIWFGTKYYILDEVLIIKCGPFKEKIKISNIKSIKKTRNHFSSPSLSLDRIEIRHGYSGISLISPKDENNFIKLILNKNTNIDFKTKETI